MRKPTRHGRVYWVLLGMLCGLAIALLTPQLYLVRSGRYPWWPMPIQRAASEIFWCCLIGAAIGLAVDVIATRPRRPFRFQCSLRSLLLLVALVASALGTCLLYMQIMAR